MSAKWTFMVYMAGNNSLSGAASADLAEMQKVGSSERLQVMAFVKQAEGPPRHIRVGQGGRDEVEKLPANTDSGEPQTVVDFVRWAARKAPADRYALVLWNHGGGWSPDDFDHLYQQVRGVRSKPEANRISSRKLSRAVFKKSIRTVLALESPQERAICSDDTSGHSLDTIEVEEVLAQVAKELGKPLDLLGMDACLMSTLEVAYQVRTHAKAVVGSEELEPGAGWCYDEILGDLAAAPDWDGRELAKAVVKRYVGSYQAIPSDWPVTQCAIDAAGVDGFTRTLDGLVTALRKRLPGAWSEILRAQARATGFEFEMVDLGSFCRSVGAATADAPLKAAAGAVAAALQPGKFVLAEGHLGQKVDGCGGVSIYFPSPTASKVSPYYKDLIFAKENKWDDFLAAYFGAVRG